ncbi:MAG: putative maltokinase [Pirellulales bacterium]
MLATNKFQGRIMEEHRQSAAVHQPPVLRLPAADWRTLLAGEGLDALERLLAVGIASRRWFGSKARRIRNAVVLDAFAISGEDRLVLVEVRFEEGAAEIYLLCLALATGPRAEHLLSEQSTALWARLDTPAAEQAAVLYEPLVDATFCGELLQLIETERRLAGQQGEIVGWRTAEFAQARGDSALPLVPRILSSEQSNTSIIFGDRLILKLFRRPDIGLNPDLELSDHLTRHGFRHTPPVAGAIEYRRGDDEPWSLASLQQFVANQGDAWQYTLAALETVINTASADQPLPAELVERGGLRLVAAAQAALPSELASSLGDFIADAARLGTRTAEMHQALAQHDNDPAFTPQPLLPTEQQAFADRASSLVKETFDLLRRQALLLSGETLRLADTLLDCRPRALADLAQFARRPISVQQIRCHGDYHLGQVLVTNDGDFVIIDFEGEPARPLAERRRKQLALRDVAGMIRSFHYASCTAASKAQQSTKPTDARAIAAKAAAWYFWTSVAFLQAYRRAVQDAPFVPRADDQFERLLDACLLEKAVYELRYELNNRPDWVYLPLTALCDLLSG